ncbi:MAG: hypothetical protein ACTHM8_00780 [Sphingomonas sp.]
MGDEKNYDREIAEWVRAHRKLSIVLLVMTFGCLMAFVAYELIRWAGEKGPITTIAALAIVAVTTVARFYSMRKRAAVESRHNR